MSTRPQAEVEQRGAVRLVLLDTPRVQIAGAAPVSLERLMAALLAMLAIDGPTPRARAASLLWPDADDKGARNNLRQRLFRLRQAAARDVVVPDTTLALADGITHDLANLSGQLEADADAVGGELLGNLAFDDCLALADWVAAARAQWSAARRNALAELASRHEADGRIASALRFAERLVTDEPLLEHAHRRLMRLHYLRGDRAAALTAFERCRDALRRELKAEPDRETLELARTIESGRTPVVVAGPAKPVTVLRPPRIVGRDREWQRIEQAWRVGRAVALLGEPGIGKTRLAGDLAAAHDGTLVSARPGDARVPYALAARLIRSLAARHGLPDESWVAQELARIAPELGAAPATRLTAVRLLRAFTAAIEHWHRAGLDALAIDDVQFADDASLELLLAQPGAEHASPNWLLGARASELPDRFAAWIAQTGTEAAVEIRLGPLGEAEVSEMLDSLAIPGLDAGRWAAPITRHTGGNPMFILETLLAMSARGAGAFADAAERLPAPEHIGQLIERRLSQLGPDALRLARVAALAGPDFSAALAVEVLGRHALDIADAWRELESAQVIREQAFAHDLICEATLRAIPQPITRLLHRQIAEYLSAQGAPPARVAGHWYEAQEWSHAGSAYADAAEAARRASRRVEEVDYWRIGADAFDRAGERDRAFDARCESVASLIIVEGTERATEVADLLLRDARTQQQRAAALIARAQARLMAADHAGGIAAAREAHDLAAGFDSPWPRFEAARLMAVGLSQCERAAEALALIEPFGDMVEREGSAEQRGRFWSDYAYALNSNRMLRRTADALARAIDNARALGDYGELATLTSNLALVHGNLGNAEAALDFMLQSRALHAQLGETHGPLHAVIDMYVGMLTGAVGRYDEALASLDAALEGFSADGQTPWSTVANNHKTLLLLDLGQVGRAMKAQEGAAPTIDSIRARREILAARIERALGRQGGEHSRAAVAILGDDGDLFMRMLALLEDTYRLPATEAARQCDTVGLMAEHSEYHGIAVKARLLRSRCLAEAGKAPTAAQLLREMPAALQDVRPADLYYGESFLIRHRVFAAAGDIASALAALQQGVEWIHGTALPNVPAEFRDSFLNRNPVNRALRNAAQGRLRITLP